MLPIVTRRPLPLPLTVSRPSLTIWRTVQCDTLSSSAASWYVTSAFCIAPSTKKPPRGRLLLVSGLSPVVSRQRLEPWRYAGRGLLGCPLHRLGPRRGLDAGEGGGGRFVHSFQKLSHAGDGTHIVGCKHCN